MRFAIVAISILFSVFSSQLYAAVYQCKDKQGNLSFSDSPCPDVKIEANNEANTVWLQMKALVEEASEVHLLLGPDRDSILRCDAKSAEYQRKLDDVESSLRKLSSRKHKRMYVAMNYLRECGGCRASAPTYCSKASAKLREETSVLVTHMK